MDERNIVEYQSAARSNYEGYNVLAQYDRNHRSTSFKIYLGKQENCGIHGDYDNSDGSLVYVSDVEGVFGLLHGEGYTLTQQAMLDNGTFTAEAYAEFARLKDGVLKQFEDRKLREPKFDIDTYIPGSGVEFQYPDWQNGLDMRPTMEKLAVRAALCDELSGNTQEIDEIIAWNARLEEVRSAMAVLETDGRVAASAQLAERGRECLSNVSEYPTTYDSASGVWRARYDEVDNIISFLERENARGTLAQEHQPVGEKRRLYVDMDGSATCF